MRPVPRARTTVPGLVRAPAEELVTVVAIRDGVRVGLRDGLREGDDDQEHDPRDDRTRDETEFRKEAPPRHGFRPAPGSCPRGGAEPE